MPRRRDPRSSPPRPGSASPSSVAKRALERMDAMLSETDEDGTPVAYNRVARRRRDRQRGRRPPRDRARSQRANDIGYTLPGQDWTYWNKAGPASSWRRRRGVASPRADRRADVGAGRSSAGARRPRSPAATQRRRVGGGTDAGGSARASGRLCGSPRRGFHAAITPAAALGPLDSPVALDGDRHPPAPALTQPQLTFRARRAPRPPASAPRARRTRPGSCSAARASPAARAPCRRG